MVTKAHIKKTPKGPSPLDEHHKSTLWTNYVTLTLGVWLASSAYLVHAQPALMCNDMISGSTVAILALLSSSLKRDWLRWLTATLGVWLLFSPLVFWAKDAFTYNNETLIGSLIIAFSFLIPGQPGRRLNIEGPDIPPGWSYNPSSWSQRGPLIAIAFIGFFLARYLAAYQLDHIPNAYDPFFLDGTKRILDSEVSKAFIISDAGLGAVSYLIDALEGFLGRANRWRTMPWAVVVFAATIVPAGVTSIVLVILQPIAVHAWCTICLAAAAAMLIMVPFAFDELVATVQFLMRRSREGKSIWRTFFLGGTDSSDGKPLVPRITSEILAGVTFPITLLISTVIGIWLMFSPYVFKLSGMSSDATHLLAALVVTIAVTAIAEACRAARLLNIMIGAALITSVFVLNGFTVASALNNVICGFAIMLLSLPKGSIRERYGSWDKYIV